MALFGLRVTQRKEAAVGGFHAAYIDKRTKLSKRPKMGIIRTTFTGLSLVFGFLMCYVALHYIPAFMQTNKVLSLSGLNTNKAAAELKPENPIERFIMPYIDAFDMQRTYLREGQTIQAQYVLPEGATLDLHIQKCRRLWVVEIFTCQTMAYEHVQVTDRTGTQAFTFRDTGFYHFKDVVTLPHEGQEYRVVWKRK